MTVILSKCFEPQTHKRLQDSDTLVAIEATILMNRILFGFSLQFFLFPVLVIAVVTAGDSGKFCFTFVWVPKAHDIPRGSNFRGSLTVANRCVDGGANTGTNHNTL